MPKLKTRKAAAKRFHVTASGKIKRGHAKMRHLLECKNSRKRRALGAAGFVDKSDLSRVRSMLRGG